jgi:hypothetical protein
VERMVGAHVSLVSKEEYVKYGSVVSLHLRLLFLSQHQERKAKMARMNIIMWLATEYPKCVGSITWQQSNKQILLAVSRKIVLGSEAHAQNIVIG